MEDLQKKFMQGLDYQLIEIEQTMGTLMWSMNWRTNGLIVEYAMET